MLLLLLYFYNDFIVADWSTERKKNTACASLSLWKQHIDNHPCATDVCFLSASGTSEQGGCGCVIHGWQKCGEYYRLCTSPAAFWKVKRLSIRKKDAGAGKNKIKIFVDTSNSHHGSCGAWVFVVVEWTVIGLIKAGVLSANNGFNSNTVRRIINSYHRYPSISSVVLCFLFIKTLSFL